MITPSRLVIAAILLAGCTDVGAPRGATEGRPSFDGESAHSLVAAQVAFGPRVPGTEGHANQLAWMLNRLDSLAPDVVADTFTHVHSETGDTLTLVNVVARFSPQATRRVVFLAHWDTRPTADAERDIALRGTPLPGANDGGSGTAILLELAALLATDAPPLGVDLLFVDGEDYGPTAADMFLGAARYAATLPEPGQPGRPLYGLLLDMVGDATPHFPVEGYSAQYASVVVNKVWRAAEALGFRDYFPTAVGVPLGDDHIALIQAGLPTADIIDFAYGPDNAFWHTSDDNLSNVSASTLGMVGEVVTELIFSGG